MAVDMKVNRRLDNNYVQVEATSKKTYTKFFKVPQDRVDAFCANYKKHDKNMKILSNTSFVASTILGCLLVSPLTRKISSGARLAVGILAGMGAATASVFGTAKIMQSKQDSLLKKFKAQEIFYSEKNFPV